MIQAGGGLGFLQKAAAALRIAGFRAGQYLNRYGAIQPGVQGFIDFTHATRAQFFKQLILLNLPPYHTTASGKLPVCHTWKSPRKGSWQGKVLGSKVGGSYL